jgi:hypothetical protein
MYKLLIMFYLFIYLFIFPYNSIIMEYANNGDLYQKIVEH